MFTPSVACPKCSYANDELFFFFSGFVNNVVTFGKMSRNMELEGHLKNFKVDKDKSFEPLAWG